MKTVRSDKDGYRLNPIGAYKWELHVDFDGLDHVIGYFRSEEAAKKHAANYTVPFVVKKGA